MKIPTLLIAALLALSAQTPAPAPPAANAAGAPATTTARPHHLVYEFGWNTKAAKSGNGTGTTTIDIGAVAPDGGVMISGTDFWWNTARARATNTCEVYPNGGVACLERPYAISPIQLTIFPLLGKSFFGGLSNGAHANWQQSSSVKAAVIPGGNVAFTGNLYTWDCVYKMEGKGHEATGTPVILVQLHGTMDQQGGRYGAAKLKAGVAFDPTIRIPVFIDETRSRLPQMSVYNSEWYQLKLIKASP